MTPQKRLTALLQQSGIPAKEIRVYGSQVMITALSEDAGHRWANLLVKFCTTVRGPVHSMDETKDTRAVRRANPGLVKSKFFHDVWRIGGSI